MFSNWFLYDCLGSIPGKWWPLWPDPLQDDYGSLETGFSFRFQVNQLPSDMFTQKKDKPEIYITPLPKRINLPVLLLYCHQS